ncbi:MAG: hypothetical protein K6A71_05670 [Lachnospiraceae bacterium]|nr:hypothetical protein [Lachnospiraceae bacterium]
MSEMITSYLANMSMGFFMDQLAVTLILFIFGFMLNNCLCRGKVNTLEILLAFPTGLSVYSLVSFLILILDLPFNRVSVTGICSLIAVICVLLTDRLGATAYTGGLPGKKIAIYLITVLCIAVISTSGLLSVSVSNDSLYYYWMYPRAMVEYEHLRPQFDVFLTDVGQTGAILNTLPFMYGFNENFGIQTFFGINTLLTVIYALYKNACARLEKKPAIISTLILSALLICTQPFVIMLKWTMSNGYFMCFMFMAVYTACEYGRSDRMDISDGGVRGRLIIAGILMTQMSMLRMEGIMIALILVLCFVPLEYKNTELAAAFLMPMFICSLAYSIRIFIIFRVDAPYTFLTPKKAFIQLSSIALVAVYVLLIRGRRADFAGRHIKLLLPLALIGVNGILFFMNKTLYLENVSAFIKNISGRSGWGLFPMYLIACYVLVFIVGAKEGDHKPEITFWDMCFICYFLASLAVCFAREDALRESIGDSGNRVLMQGTLLAFFAAADHITGLILPPLIEDAAGN